jgi:hypothetical protein
LFTRSRAPISPFCRHHGPHRQAPVGEQIGGSRAASTLLSVIAAEKVNPPRRLGPEGNMLADVLRVGVPCLRTGRNTLGWLPADSRA